MVIVKSNNEAKVVQDIVEAQYFAVDEECQEARTTVMIDHPLVLTQEAIVQDILKETHVLKQINQVLMVSSLEMHQVSNRPVQSTNRNLRLIESRRCLVRMMQFY
jgi:hypothetical protein